MSAVKLEKLWSYRVRLKDAPLGYKDFLVSSKEEAVEEFLATLEPSERASLLLVDRSSLVGPFYRVVEPVEGRSPWADGPPPKDGRPYVVVVEAGGMTWHSICRWSGRSFEIEADRRPCRPEHLVRHVREPIPPSPG